MAAIWLRCVERIAGVSDVLRAMEHSKSQTREKVARRQITSDGPKLKSSFPFQKHADVLKLGQIVLTIPAILDELRPVLHVLRNGVL